MTDPSRPSDHIDASTGSATDEAGSATDEAGSATDGDGPTQPKLGVVGWLRWAWRQLTSMRTALVLLLLLAVAAVPGSIFPQRSADPNGVVQYERDHASLYPVLDKLQFFDVYSSVWFSAIYLLLFVSLIGCILPRAKHHFTALRTKPPRTPARLGRLDDFLTDIRESDDADGDAKRAIDLAQRQLRRAGYRVERYDGGGAFSVSAERGYLRETGNLIFHAALVGVLVCVAIGQAFSYTGQKAVVEGTTFVNSLVDYNSMNRGALVSDDALKPYAMKLTSFDITFQPPGTTGGGQSGDFSANVSVTHTDGSTSDDSVRVNHPLRLDGDAIYLLGNGYAPTITVRNADGDVVFHDSVIFLVQSSTFTSLGVVKVPDGLDEQLGMIGFFYPTAVTMDSGAMTSSYGDLIYPVLTLNVYAGDLGIDAGDPKSVYELDTTDLTQLTGGDTGVDSIELMPGESADLPNGLGSVTFDDERGADADSSDGYEGSVKRFASLQVHHDPTEGGVLLFVVLAVAGLLAGLFVPRRRIWVKATPDRSLRPVLSSSKGRLKLEYAGLARGEDPTLAAALASVREKHRASLD
ncbi:MAG: cytochrome c biogenesis protein ResB [Microbacterium sp.]